MDWEHITAIIWMSIFGIIGGVLLSLRNIYLIGLGIILILIDVYLEYYFLKKMDTRNDVNKTKQELREYVDEARKLKNELEKTAKEIEDIKDKIFDIFSKKGFKTIEERLKDLENVVEGRHRVGSLSKLKEDVEKIKNKLNIWP